MEENEKKEEKSGRKKAIKNFAIVFVIALLVLTFFSNTIMNHSLPEVSTTTVSSGSVSQKVRCQGDVETAKDVELTVSGDRVVKEVLVESGDEVKKGDVIATFNEAENPELKRAEDELRTLEIAHQKNMIKLDPSYEEDYVELEKYRVAIEDAEKGVRKAKENEASTVYSKEQLEAKKQEMLNQQSVVNELQGQFDVLAESYGYTEKLEVIAAKEKELEEVPKRIEELQKNIVDWTDDLNDLNTLLTNIKDPDDPAVAKTYADIESIEGSIAKANEELTIISGDVYTQELQQEIDDLKYEIKDVTAVAASLAEEKAQLADLEAEIEAASTADPTAVSVEDAEKALKTAQETYETKLRAIENKKKQDDIQQQKDNIDMKKEMDDLEAKRKEVQKLKDHDDTANIVAPNDGILTNITMKDGEKVAANTTVATIQLAESGYEVSATVSKSDGRLIRVGDEAAIENVWSQDASAVVKSIKPDPNDPNKNVVVKFEVKGSDISVGQTLQFAVGEKSQKYDTVVPNNAVKEDTTGNFVLVVKVKSTPLGNRYTVKKVEVKKLASDTTKCAISGDVSEYDNVVTNASKRLENGQQVRLSEKQ